MWFCHLVDEEEEDVIDDQGEPSFDTLLNAPDLPQVESFLSRPTPTSEVGEGPVPVPTFDGTPQSPFTG